MLYHNENYQLLRLRPTSSVVFIYYSLFVAFINFLQISTVSGGKEWQTTPKNLPRMQCARATPVTGLSSGSCQPGL